MHRQQLCPWSAYNKIHHRLNIVANVQKTLTMNADVDMVHFDLFFLCSHLVRFCPVSSRSSWIFHLQCKQCRVLKTRSKAHSNSSHYQSIRFGKHWLARQYLKINRDNSFINRKFYLFEYPAEIEILSDTEFESGLNHPELDKIELTWSGNRVRRTKTRSYWKVIVSSIYFLTEK